jgi:hypothetical protein
LNETVWDNATGPFWDVEESKQIGFTQDYSKFVPVAATAGVFGGAIGGAVVGVTLGPELVNTRIVIPFGNAFSNIFDSAVQKNFTASKICFDDMCVNKLSPSNILKIKIDNFLVWEAPLNHLNLYTKGKSTHMFNGEIIKEYNFEKSMLSQKLGGMLSTHSKFLNEMNRLINQFSEELTVEILEKGL